MKTQDLPQIEFSLSPADRQTATVASIFLERQRRERNARDKARADAALARQLERAFQGFDGDAA